MKMVELVEHYARGLKRHGPHAWVNDTMRLDVLRVAFPRPDLLEWFDGIGGAQLPPRQYGLGLLYAFAAESAREAPEDVIVVCAREADLATLAKISMRSAVFERISPPAAPQGSAGVVKLIFGWLDDPGDAETVSALLSVPASVATRVVVMSGAVHDLVRPWLDSAGPGLPGHPIFISELQSFNGDRHVVVCRNDRPEEG